MRVKISVKRVREQEIETCTLNTLGKDSYAKGSEYELGILTYVTLFTYHT